MEDTKPSKTPHAKVETPNAVMQWALEKMDWDQEDKDSLMDAADNFFQKIIIEAFNHHDLLDPEDLVKPPEPTYTELELPFEVTQWAFKNLRKIKDLPDNEEHQAELETYFSRMIIRAYNRDVVG